MTPADVFAALGCVPKLDGARCKGESEVFDNEHGSPELQEYALNLCASCSALPDCREWLDSLPKSRKPLGIIAGTVRHQHKCGVKRASIEVEDV